MKIIPLEKQSKKQQKKLERLEADYTSCQEQKGL